MSVTDVSDADPNAGVMVALLPITTDWSQLDLPHLTIVYAGLVKDLPATAFNDLAKDAASVAMLSNVITLKVMGVDTFGDVDKVDVLTLRPSSELLAMRQMLEVWNASQFSFSPHATIGPLGSRMSMPFVPDYLAFDRIMVGWGGENLTFWLRR